MDFLKNIPANVFTTTAFAVGLLLTDDATPAEQNSIGNWFMLLAQVLCTNAAQQQVINTANNKGNIGPHIINDNTTQNNSNDVDSQIQMMQRAINALQQEINSLKK